MGFANHGPGGTGEPVAALLQPMKSTRSRFDRPSLSLLP